MNKQAKAPLDSFPFNLTHTPHFNNPVNSVAAGNFMRITSTSANPPERILRFGFKLGW